jgi:flagellar biosynthesis protein FliR
MPTSQEHPFLRPPWLNSYLAYSIGCAVAWGVVWVIVAITAPKSTIDHVAYVFGGWVIGWVSASIARMVYPPPRQPHGAGPRSFFQGSRES